MQRVLFVTSVTGNKGYIQHSRCANYLDRRKIRLVDTNSKCRHLKKLTCIGTSRQVFICLRPPPLLGYCLGWSINFVGSESGQIQSVKLLQNVVSNRTQYPLPLPAIHCLYIHVHYCILNTGKVRGTIVHKAESKISTWLTVSLVYKL